MKIDVLDHGFVRLVEAWGHGDGGTRETLAPDEKLFWDSTSDDYEVGIIEAARQSTQASFRGWEAKGWRSRCCGALWRDNGDGSMSLADDRQKPCKECDNGPMGQVEAMQATTWPEDAKLLKFLHNNKHSTPFEFAGMVIEVRAPIFVFREWHRHRTQSYNEMSARYAPLPDMNYVPTYERVMMGGGKNKQAGAAAGARELDEVGAKEFIRDLVNTYDVAQVRYERALAAGVPKELARAMLPVGRYSQMRASANLRNWLQFLTLRQDLAAQWEIRQFANAVARIVEFTFPRTWELWSAPK